MSTTVGDPQCCGEPMVRYPFVAWECADAFFTLLDDGVLEGDGGTPPRLVEAATAGHRDLLAHLLATRIPIHDQS